MPRTLDPDKYPDDYWALLSAAQAGPVVIPRPGATGAKGPAGLRGYIQSFLRAVEAGGSDVDKVRAKAIQVTAHMGDPTSPDPRKHEPHVIVCRRADSAYGRAVSDALGAIPVAQKVASAEAALRASLLAPSP